MRRLLLLLTLVTAPLLSHAIEEPKYEVIRQFDTVELRQYAPYVVAEVVLDATAEEAGSRAFPILAGYNSPMTPWFMRRNEIWLELR